MIILAGCSTLGIATLDDLEATETRLQNAQRATDTRTRTNEQAIQQVTTDVASLTEMQQQIQASVAQLDEQFAAARTWLESMDLESMAESADRTEAAALMAEQRSRNIIVGYLEWARKHRAMLDEQINTLQQAVDNPAALESDADGQ
jgi:chromosome segregation ATPase